MTHCGSAVITSVYAAVSVPEETGLIFTSRLGNVVMNRTASYKEG